MLRRKQRVGETLYYLYHSLEGIKTNVIRPFNVFGPRMQENDYRVLPNFASQVKKGKALKFMLKSDTNLCYITDAIEGFESYN